METSVWVRRGAAGGEKPRAVHRRPPSAVPLGRPRTFKRSTVYSTNDLMRLVDGWIFDELEGQYRPAGGSNPDDDGSFLQIRSRMEVTGDVDSVEFTEMLDVERAVGRLREAHPMSAAVLVLSMMGWTPAEIESTFRKLHQPAGRHYDKAIQYCRAYLSGEDAEAAFMRGSKPRESTALKSA